MTDTVSDLMWKSLSARYGATSATATLTDLFARWRADEGLDTWDKVRDRYFQAAPGSGSLVDAQYAFWGVPMSDAVFWIDAGLEPQTASGASAQWVLNRGDARVGHARVGSAGRAELRGRFGLLLPGAVGNYASTPDSAALDITGDIDIRVLAALTDWTPSTTQTLVAKWGASGNRSFRLNIPSSGRPILEASVDGANFGQWTASVAPTVADGASLWLRVTLDVDNGSSGASVVFYTSSDGGASWTQLGTTQTTAGTTSIFNSNAIFEVGSTNSGTANSLSGTIARTQIRNGIDGTVVFDADFTTAPEFASSFTAATGQTVTINATSGADSNDPIHLPHTGTNYLYLPGVGGNNASTPDAASLDITGDIDIRVRVAMDDWTPAALQVLASKWASSTGNNSFYFGVDTTGTLILVWTESGGTIRSANSTVAPTVTDGSALWVRATLDVDSGGQWQVKFFTAADSSSVPTSWTQVGADVNGTSGVTNIISGAGNIEIGSRGTIIKPAAGRFFRAQIRDGIDGTVVFDADFTTGITSGGQTSFTASTGQTVTINRSTSGRKAVAVVRPVWLFGTDDYMEVADNDLLDFEASESFTVMAVVRQWETVTGSRALVAKRTGSATQVGYAVRESTVATNIAGEFSDGTSEVNAVATRNANTSLVYALVRNVASDNSTVYSAGSPGTPASDTTTGTLANSDALNIGRYSGTTSYSDMELLAVAVWRRALTAAEITAITNYYGAA